MIQRLHIRNYAIIKETNIEFDKGLTIITGETGAGKSILLGALGMIMGNRVDTKSLFNPDKKCVVEAVFNVKDYDLEHFFETHDLDYEKEVVIRREITKTGKSRAFVNDTPTTIKALQQLTSNLIDLHQQFDTLDIHNVNFQLRMVDALAGNQATLTEYQKLYKIYAANIRELNKLEANKEKSEKEFDFLSFQLEELEGANMEAGEQESLENELKLLQNAERIQQVMGGAYDTLVENEQSLTGVMAELSMQLRSIHEHHPAIKNAYERFESLNLELQDLSEELNRIAEQTEADPARALEAQERLDLIYKLENKHHVGSVEELIEIKNKIEQQLETIGDVSGAIEELEGIISEQEKELFEIANILSERRQKIIPAFESQVMDLLAELSMQHAILKIDCQQVEDLTNAGIDQIQFLFSANKGGRLELIKDVASGGELSRLTLCAKSLVASAIPLPTLIFDEIDTGISGDVALKMGDILRRLSDEHQVIVITHTPQVASKADRHYYIYKSIEDDKTISNMKILDKKERIHEIAVMMSGTPPEKAALEAAKGLLKR